MDNSYKNIDLDFISLSFDFKEEITSIVINEQIKYQKWKGFGGSITGSVAFNLNSIDLNLRKCIYKLFFSPTEGLGYTFLKWPIGGTDFDLTHWMYNELPENDVHLTNFTELHESDKLKV